MTLGRCPLGIFCSRGIPPRQVPRVCGPSKPTNPESVTLCQYGSTVASPSHPASLHPAPYTLHPAPYTLHPIPYTLHPTPYILYPTPCTLDPTSYTLHPTPCTPLPTPYALHPTPYPTPHPNRLFIPNRGTSFIRNFKPPRTTIGL